MSRTHDGSCVFFLTDIKSPVPPSSQSPRHGWSVAEVETDTANLLPDSGAGDEEGSLSNVKLNIDFGGQAFGDFLAESTLKDTAGKDIETATKDTSKGDQDVEVTLWHFCRPARMHATASIGRSATARMCPRGLKRGVHAHDLVFAMCRCTRRPWRQTS